MYNRLCVQRTLEYGCQVRYPSNNYRRMLELLDKKCLFRVTVLQIFSQQLATSSTLPISSYLAVYDMGFLNRSINNKYDSNLCTYICFIKPSKKFKTPTTVACENMPQTFHEGAFLKVCSYSNFLATREIDVFDSLEKYKHEVLAYLRNQVRTLN